MSADLPRRLLAEAIGPGILVMFGAAAAFAFDAVARPRLFELEVAQGTQGVIEGQRGETPEPAAPTTTRREERYG